ncbi:DUF6883 domain-containing protein [Methylobacterium sp. 174MFSha1.1]|uniref:DUF6883 domain-containing protein n=1 Tax=Methylobacterium sp. 174MFSha1.1 TaxID=1502749 RepID=UPI001160ACE9|nr:DUF6883 domain-containing protein [Methylobacterium sp. 174MFSha1.1]
MTPSQVPIAWLIDNQKISGYLLNIEHPHGASKAKYLMRFGFRPESPDALASALVEHALKNLPGLEVVPPGGSPKIVFEGVVAAPDGRDMPLRTVWKRRAPFEMRFVTAVPLTR